MPNQHVHLVLFFTRGVSLRQWDRLGIFEREVALYRRLRERGMDVTFVTYGGSDDERYARRLDGIRVCVNRWGLSKRIYGRLIPWLHRDVLRRCDVIKTNQFCGGQHALRAARDFGKPLIARGGYMWSAFEESKSGGHSSSARLARRTEDRVFTAADRIVVTTPQMADGIAARLPAAAQRIRVVPNYVDTALFVPRDEVKTHDLLFLGRLRPQKNIEQLLEAIRPLDVRLLMIGGGAEAAAWKQRWASLGDRVTWLGSVPHGELPRHFSAVRAFILPSLYEGHPKALIEAMACGCACIGTDVPGIRELIRHGDNGFLCGTSATEIRNAITHVLGEGPLRASLGQRARQFAQRQFSLDHIVSLETEIVEEAIHHGEPGKIAA